LGVGKGETGGKKPKPSTLQPHWGGKGVNNLAPLRASKVVSTKLVAHSNCPAKRRKKKLNSKNFYFAKNPVNEGGGVLWMGGNQKNRIFIRVVVRWGL